MFQEKPYWSIEHDLALHKASQLMRVKELQQVTVYKDEGSFPGQLFCRFHASPSSRHFNPINGVAPLLFRLAVAEEDRQDEEPSVPVGSC